MRPRRPAESTGLRPLAIDDEMLTAMAAEIAGSGSVLAPSRFWEGFAKRNAGSLRADGATSFKRSVNFNYFQWVINSPRQPEFRAVIKRWLRSPSFAALRARVCVEGVDWERPRAPKQLPLRWRPLGHAIYVGMLWDIARRRVPADALAPVEEPLLGNPIAVRSRGRRVSEDLANTVLEYGAFAEHVSSDRLSTATLLEVGAGYGRFVDLLLTMHPGARAFVVDIPPALALSQTYLTARHPRRRAHRFSGGLTGAELEDALAGVELAFLTPNQLQSLGPIRADLVINTSSLHEMLPVQVEEYFRLFDRHAAGGFFYTKQWKRWHNPVDDVQTDERGYPYPAHWTRLIDRTPVAQPEFFEALFAL